MARIDEKHVGVARVYGLAALRLAEKQGKTEEFLGQRHLLQQRTTVLFQFVLIECPRLVHP